ncbi:MAG: hypothetical protein NTY53_26255 [Kiritimatiellaeota bacterium]|nr:hypothetical protein [Kiritimatiellota bacterium]
MKKWILFVVAALLLLGGWGLGWHMRGSSTAVPVSQLMQMQKRSEPGPWGRIVYDYSMIEMAPALWQHVQQAPPAVEWKLHVSNPEAVRQQLLASGFTPEQVQVLMATLTPIAGGYALHPGDDFIFAMTPDVRRNWYAVLAIETDNPDYDYPLRFWQKTQVGWLDDSDVDPQILALAQKLIYKNGELQLMADMSLLQRTIREPAIMQRVACVLSRETTIVPYLLVGPEDNIEQLANYWGYPDRQDAVRTLLRATQRSGFDRPIPIGMLVTRFVRDRVNRYWRATDPVWPHCHFTSLNFFNDTPDEGCTNDTYATSVILRDYITVTTPPRLGDLILFKRGPDEIIHSCNYIADGIVFTKNGGSLGHPWMFARLDDMMDFYSYPTPVQISFMRRRDLPPPPVAG